jgi:LysM repeat protein
VSVTAGLEKAQIQNLDKGQVFHCQFNPAELSITKQNTWTAEKPAGGHIPAVHFGGAGARSLKLTLIFDTLESRGEQDVSKVTEGLLALMDATENETVQKKKQARPPHVEFVFGHWRSFTSVITQFDQKFTLFQPNGIPVRATVNVTLQEVPAASPKQKAKGQNPTSLAAGTRRVHQVQPGDTLDLIAANELGDPNAWRRIAAFNQIEDPRRLKPGRLLAIPPDDLASLP